MPDSVATIGLNPFISCENLTRILIFPDNQTLETVDGVLFSKPDRRLICYSNAFAPSEYKVSEGTEIIGDSAFFGCSSLIAVTVPGSVTAIGNDAFCYCDSLTAVTIPGSVTIIGDSAFSDCDSLNSITIPDSVTAIGDDAFYNCNSLTVIFVGRDSYAKQYCIDHDLPCTDANDRPNG